MDAMEYDVVVVGGGAAGLTAAIYLARSLRRVVVVDAGEPRNVPAAHVHGFLSRDGTPPADLLAAGRVEVLGYGGEVIKDRVLGIEHGGEHGFLVRLIGGAELTARGVLVATGLRDELPEIVGLRERWGTDVLHCPYCHGYEVRDTPIGVLGGDNRPFTLHQASLVRQWSADVVFFPNQITLVEEEREQLTARGIRIVYGEVTRLAAQDDQLLSVELADGQAVYAGSGVHRASIRAAGRAPDRPWVRSRRDRLGRHRRHGPHQRAGGMGGRQRRGLTGPGDHRRRRRIGRCNRDQPLLAGAGHRPGRHPPPRSR